MTVFSRLSWGCEMPVFIIENPRVHGSNPCPGTIYNKASAFIRRWGFFVGEGLIGSLSLAIDKFCIIDTITEGRRLA